MILWKWTDNANKPNIHKHTPAHSQTGPQSISQTTPRDIRLRITLMRELTGWARLCVCVKAIKPLML